MSSEERDAPMSLFDERPADEPHDLFKRNGHQRRLDTFDAPVVEHDRNAAVLRHKTPAERRLQLRADNTAMNTTSVTRESR